MNTKSRTLLAAAFLFSSVAGAMAYEGPQTIEEWNYQLNPNAPIPQYLSQTYALSGPSQGRVIERRGAVAGHNSYVPGAARYHDFNGAR